MSEHIEFQYSAGDGHTWMLRCDRGRLCDAADAVFQWFATVDEFGPKHLGVFLAAILLDAIEQQALCEESYRIVARIIHAVPQMEAGHAAKVNLIREIVHAALDSSG